MNRSHFFIPPSELVFMFSRSGGRGGQNVNKVATKATVRWRIGSSAAVSETEKQRLRTALRNRLTADDELMVSAETERSQAQNRARAAARLNELVRRALAVPKKRRATRPTRGSKERRMQEKKVRSLTKHARRYGVDY